MGIQFNTVRHANALAKARHARKAQAYYVLLRASGANNRRPDLTAQFLDVDTTTVHTSACGIDYRRDKRGVSLPVVRAFSDHGKPVRTPGPAA